MTPNIGVLSTYFWHTESCERRALVNYWLLPWCCSKLTLTEIKLNFQRNGEGGKKRWRNEKLLLWPAVPQYCLLQDKNMSNNYFEEQPSTVFFSLCIKKDIFQTIFRIYCLVAGNSTSATGTMFPAGLLQDYISFGCLPSTLQLGHGRLLSRSASLSLLPPPSMASFVPGDPGSLWPGPEVFDPVRCPWCFMSFFSERAAQPTSVIHSCHQAKLTAEAILALTN